MQERENEGASEKDDVRDQRDKIEPSRRIFKGYFYRNIFLSLCLINLYLKVFNGVVAETKIFT